MRKSTTPPGPRFVVYTLCLPNGTPFYVGRGTRQRPYAHDSEARRGCPCAKCETIRKVWVSGKEIARCIVLATDDEQEAITGEADTIALYDLRTLTNKNVGHGYVRDRHIAVPKVDSTDGERHNQTSHERLMEMLDTLFQV
jgi:hypothetical protein